jgi:hypothetical protein
MPSRGFSLCVTFPRQIRSRVLLCPHELPERALLQMITVVMYNVQRGIAVAIGVAIDAARMEGVTDTGHECTVTDRSEAAGKHCFSLIFFVSIFVFCSAACFSCPTPRRFFSFLFFFFFDLGSPFSSSSDGGWRWVGEPVMPLARKDQTLVREGKRIYYNKVCAVHVNVF